jgi:colanic acid biosynthesis glycosyl transferase WcaI
VPKRFLILTQHFPPEVGAAQNRLHAFAKQLQAHGHQVRIVTAMPNYPLGEVFPEYRGVKLAHEEFDGLPVTRTRIMPATGRNVFRRLLSYWSFAISSLPACMREPRPDFIFVESPPLFLGCTAYVCSRLRRVPFILNVSDLWPESARALGIVRSRTLLWFGERLEHFLYRKAHRITAQTDGIRTHIAAIVGPAKVMVLYNGVDTTDYKPRPDASVPWIEKDEIAFLYAGTFGYQHCWDVILESAELLRSRPDIVFLMVGDGPEKTRLVEAARLRDLRNVRFIERRPVVEMPALFASSRATVVPMRKGELFKGTRPSKVSPSLACGSPVVFGGEGETAKLLLDNGCGIVVPPENSREFADAVVRLADNPELAREMGRRGRALVEREYGWDTLVGAWLQELPAEKAG